jgi:hypothetical protein
LRFRMNKGFCIDTEAPTLLPIVRQLLEYAESQGEFITKEVWDAWRWINILLTEDDLTVDVPSPRSR